MTSEVVPDSSGVGNTNSTPEKKKTKQIAPAKRWCFTLNNYDQNDISSINSLSSKCFIICVGKEIGEKGTPHLQGYCEFLTKLRPLSLQLNKGIHWEKCKGNRKENIDYCSKENNVIISKNIPRKIKIIENLYPWQQDIYDLYKSDIDDRKIYWFYETEGNIGKSAFIKYMIVKHNILFCSGGKYSDIMNLVFNNDMDFCDCIMFDIPRAHEGHISYASLESIKNGMVCNTKYETGTKIFNSPHLFIFANYPPDDVDMLSKDRWVIKELKP